MGKKPTGGGIGEYVIRVVDERGEQVGDDLHCLSRTRSPNLGEYVSLRGSIYVAVNVIHSEAEPARTAGRTVAPYTLPLVLVRATEFAGAAPRSPTDRDTLAIVSLDAKRAEASLRSGESYYFPPSLIAVLACIGYREQATAFASRSRVAAELVYLGWTWFVDPIRSDPGELWLLSRGARRSYGALDLVFGEIVAAGAIGSWDEPSLRPAPASPPRLALVR